ncbi:hypothetical protein FKP32DRAFT_419984 [Trametes sanguinea]|nr:hypothetical protein FKP32DRAFT_419984 [Trametes sanguinea]
MCAQLYDVTTSHNLDAAATNMARGDLAHGSCPAHKLCSSRQRPQSTVDHSTVACSDAARRTLLSARSLDCSHGPSRSVRRRTPQTHRTVVKTRLNGTRRRALLLICICVCERSGGRVRRPHPLTYHRCRRRRRRRRLGHLRVPAMCYQSCVSLRGVRLDPSCHAEGSGLPLGRQLERPRRCLGRSETPKLEARSGLRRLWTLI